MTRRIAWWFGGFAALASAAIAGPAAPVDRKPVKVASVEQPPAKLGLVYSIRFWGVPFGHADFDSHFQTKTYNTTSRFETSGIVSFFWEAKIEASSNGQVAPHALAPAQYDSLYQRGSDKKERVKVSYSGQAPTVEADPPYPTTDFPVSDEQKKEAVDPLSAVTLILTGLKSDAANPCGTVAPVFDGRRRYNIEFTYLKDETPDIDTPLGKGKAHLCQLHYHQIAGFKPKIMKEGKEFPPVYGWFVDVPSANAPGGHYEIAVKLWAAYGIGTVSVVLSQIQVDGAELAPKG